MLPPSQVDGTKANNSFSFSKQKTQPALYLQLLFASLSMYQKKLLLCFKLSSAVLDLIDDDQGAQQLSFVIIIHLLRYVSCAGV
jgi:hypothetical protein